MGSIIISPIDFKIDDNSSGKISFEAPIHSGERNNELKIYEEAYVTFTYSVRKNIYDILKDITSFLNSITLFTNEQSYPTSILFRDKSFLKPDSKTNQRKFISCHYTNSFFDINHQIRHRGEFLVDYSDIENNYPTIINNWFRLFEEMESVMMLLLKYYKKKYQFSSTQFMDIIQAIENFHRINYNNQRISKEKFETLVKTILSQVNLENGNLEWLESRLKGNEPILRNRLKELIKDSEIQAHLTKMGNVNSFCWKVTNSRNYYTHYDKKKKEESAKSTELLEITRTLRAILISNILKKIEIPVQSYENGLRYHLG